jgi:3-oxoacyl-[acyl-carrier-protein] synthase III
MFINGASHYLPKKIIPNEYYRDLIGLSDEWIFKRSGIKNRTRAGAGENTNSMSIRAVKTGIDRMPYGTQDIDLIVGATYTPYDTVGTLAHAVQGHFDIPKARVLSISTACSSFLNAVEVVEGLFTLGKARYAIVVATEHNSAYSDDKDSQTGHLWGDGSAAVFLSKEQVSHHDMEVIAVNTSGLGHVGKGIEGISLRPNEGGIKMPHGRDIFTHATKYMVSETLEILEKNHFCVSDIAYFIPHQANSRIIDSVANGLGLHRDTLITNVEDIGNTGCASTAIALSQNWELFPPGRLVVMTVFGGGYSSGAMLLRRVR